LSVTSTIRIIRQGKRPKIKTPAPPWDASGSEIPLVIQQIHKKKSACPDLGQAQGKAISAR
jgi:hypothetical protein